MQAAESVPFQARRRRALRMMICVMFLSCPNTVSAGTFPPLGLCPSETSRLDGFMQAVCAGERALTAGRPADAIASFRIAAEEKRFQATNELAWAGLAAAYCQSRDVKRGREWATRFEEARQIWIGEADCSPGASARRPQGFVREHLCVAPLEADYGFLKSNPEASVSIEIQRRFSHVISRIEDYCVTAKSKDSVDASSKTTTVKKSVKKKPKKKLTGKAASPAQGR